MKKLVRKWLGIDEEVKLVYALTNENANLKKKLSVLDASYCELDEKIDNIRSIEGQMMSNYLQCAGTVDLIADYEGKISIIDWKTSKAPKKEEWVEDYKYQLGAYYLAHTKNYGPIEQGVISICTRDLQYQEFRLNESDLKEYGDKFLERVEQFNKLTATSS